MPLLIAFLISSGACEKLQARGKGDRPASA
jgi:hypothetical protein